MKSNAGNRPAEVFGYPIGNKSSEAQDIRQEHQCPFVNKRCNKKSRLIDYPFGICSVEHHDRIYAVCPRRFEEQGTIEKIPRVLEDIALHYFGDFNNVIPFPEVKLPNVGTIDYVLVRHKPMRAEVEDFVTVVRGIATGANEFFVLPTQMVKRYALEPYVVRTLQRNREVQDIIFDEAKWQALSDEGKRVWLLYLNGDDVSEYSALRAYLAEGEARGYHLRSLVQTRKKWYAMEQRDIPAIFFTILTRGNPRFILNLAGIRPLNMFSLIYPNRHVAEAGATDLLWALLNSNFSLSRLHSVSRTYGGNTLKVEPRELDNLPVVNPLALPDDARQKIREWIDDFYHRRQASVLMRQVDELAKTLLATEATGLNRSPLPIQLRLLEKEDDYKGQ